MAMSIACWCAAGSGALTHGEPDSAGCRQPLRRRPSPLPYNDIGKVREVFEAMGDQIAAVIVESYPANAGLIFPKATCKGLRDVTLSMARCLFLMR